MKRYQPNKYGDQIVQKTTDMIVHDEVIGNMILSDLIETHVVSEESFLGLGLTPENEKKLYHFDPDRTVYHQTSFDTVMFSLEFRLGPDVKFYNRSIYTGLDLIGDIGGLFDGL